MAEILAQVVDDDSMLTPSQKTKFLKRVKSGKIKVDKSDDYDVVLDTPRFVVYVPNTHEASMKLGKGTEWCTAHENPDWYNDYTENGHKLYIIKDKKTGERWQYSDKTGDFLDENDDEFDIMTLLGQDDADKLSKFFEKFLGVDYYNFDGTLIYTGQPISDNLKERVEDVVIPNSVTSIGSLAFMHCSHLTSITIPNSVTSIGEWAFYGCSRLTSITIPNSVTSIGRNAFDSCSSLTSITIPDSITIISDFAFLNCSSLTSITIPNSVIRICSYAFENCSSLKSITIPDSITHIGYSVFKSCSSLTSITIPNSIKNIGNYVFSDCFNLTSIIIPNSITSIGYKAFWSCSKLTVYTNNDYAKEYCQKYHIPVKSLKARYESYKPLKLRIREY